MDATALRHEYEVDPRGRPVVPTPKETEQAEYLDTVSDRYFGAANEIEPGNWGLDAAFDGDL
jgi:hypothetical protein